MLAVVEGGQEEIDKNKRNVGSNVCVMYISVFEECYKPESLLKLHSGHEHVGDGSRDVAKKLYVLLNSPGSLVYGLPIKSFV